MQKIEDEVDKNMELARLGQTKLQAIPQKRINFVLRDFRVSLVNQGYGLQLFSQDFKVTVSLFDATNKYNKKSFAVTLSQQVYGLDILAD